MLKYFMATLATALALLVVDIVLPGVSLANFPAAMIAAVVIGLVNASIRPVLKLLSLPITLLTLGLFSLVVNGICFWLASILVPGFVVRGLVSIIVGPIILSFVNTFLTQYFAQRETAKLTAGQGMPMSAKTESVEKVS